MRILSTLALAVLSTASFADVYYTISPEPQNGQLRVTIKVDNPGTSEAFRIPAWCPGFYFLQDYQKKISDFKATDDGGVPLTVDHAADPRLWTIANPEKKAFTVSYRVLGDDPGLGFFATSVLPRAAFVNGSSAFMYGVDRKLEATHLKVSVPQGWDVATPADPDGDGGYRSNGYDELVDHPIQMGRFERRTFMEGSIPFEVIFVAKDGNVACDMDAETARLKKVSAPAIALFGGAAFKRYTYFIHLAVGNFAGGLEHRASNVQAIGNSNPLNIDALAAHEYFHAWNVKQIRPSVLGPFDYTQPVRTSNLWFSEGVTDYYAYVTTYRSGLQDSAWLLANIGNQVRELQNGKERLKTTLAQTSQRAWENGGFGVNDLSYYTKGFLVGWIFDAVIRDATNGERSLDDVMRVLFQRHALPKPGFGEDELLKVINEISGTDQSKLYDLMVNSTGELPYDLVKKLGLSVSADWKVSLDPSATGSAIELRKQWLNRPAAVTK